jgi:adenine-specific DNA-methyltransferase
MAKRKTAPTIRAVESIVHDSDKRKNIPTAEHQSVIAASDAQVTHIRYPRNADLDPQLVWRGKDEQDWSDLVVPVPPLYIQEKVNPKALVDDLLRASREREHDSGDAPADLFSDFDGIPHGVDKTEFYRHDQNWSNRMILGDSLQVMASLAEREGLRGKVQCIYFDPPYGIKFNSNFQWSTQSRDVKDGKADHITREPEQVKAFRDTWRDGIHSYLTYLRDRLTVARDLLTESGSLFVQIGDENVHRVRALIDEVIGEDNFVAAIAFRKTGSHSDGALGASYDYLLWFAKSREHIKIRRLFSKSELPDPNEPNYVHLYLEGGMTRRMLPSERRRETPLPPSARVFRHGPITGQGESAADRPINHLNRIFKPQSNRHWSTSPAGIERAIRAGRVGVTGENLSYLLFWDEVPGRLPSIWEDTQSGGFLGDQIYVVQTTTKVVERCLLMTTDPGDLVLDPTCGSGTTAIVAEQWGRRWITVDTSRVALALARARVMGAKYPYYFLADSRDGQLKEAAITRAAPSSQPVHGDIRHGFVYERVPHITLKSIANNTEIDVIWEQWQTRLEPLREKLNAALKKTWQEWQIPREADDQWPDAARKLHADWWQARIARQQEIDKSIAAKAEFELLYDKPYEDKKKVRVAGPFTVESLSPHRTLIVGADDELIDPLASSSEEFAAKQSFTQVILENLRSAGVQQASKADKIAFTSLNPWAGDMVCAEGRYQEGDTERKAAIFIGPEFGTVQRADLVDAAKEAGDAGFDVLIACAFNYDAHATEFSKLGRIPVLKARMNADLHMADDLKNTGKGNLFVVFGEPDIELISDPDGRLRIQVRGVDVFDPSTGEVRSDTTDGIACWFIDTDYNEESFFVRHAYFLGANDPYTSLKTTLKTEVDREAWESLKSDVSRPFPRPKSGRIAVKVINHLGDEVMRVLKV